MPPRSVVLIGFMAAGKTAVGRALADRLGFEFCDTDAMVVEASGRSVADLFAAEGEEGFRVRERDAVVRAAARPKQVVACGGGAILSVRNYGVLKGAGPIVYLRTSPDELVARLGNGEGRPLLAGDPKTAVPKLLAERAPAYETAADLVVDTDGRSPAEIATEIAEKLA
ncbi:MAG: shikimate kinase [Actinomycetota bacterium]